MPGELIYFDVSRGFVGCLAFTTNCGDYRAHEVGASQIFFRALSSCWTTHLSKYIYCVDIKNVKIPSAGTV